MCMNPCNEYPLQCTYICCCTYQHTHNTENPSSFQQKFILMTSAETYICGAIVNTEPERIVISFHLYTYISNKQGVGHCFMVYIGG